MARGLSRDRRDAPFRAAQLVDRPATRDPVRRRRDGVHGLLPRGMGERGADRGSRRDGRPAMDRGRVERDVRPRVRHLRRRGRGPGITRPDEVPSSDTTIRSIGHRPRVAMRATSLRPTRRPGRKTTATIGRSTIGAAGSQARRAGAGPTRRRGPVSRPGKRNGRPRGGRAEHLRGVRAVRRRSRFRSRSRWARSGPDRSGLGRCR